MILLLIAFMIHQWRHEHRYEPNENKFSKMPLCHSSCMLSFAGLVYWYFVLVCSAHILVLLARVCESDPSMGALLGYIICCVF